MFVNKTLDRATDAARQWKVTFCEESDVCTPDVNDEQ
jgi:hypothetical protein